MSGLMPVARAVDMVLEGIEPLEAETVPLADAHGRVLAHCVTAARTQPPFPASAMDGYAVRAEDVETVPVPLTQIGQSAAGHGFRGQVNAGECVRIFTGAPVPEGADTIVIQENTEVDGDKVTINKREEAGRYVRRKGYDFSEGETLIAAGTVADAATVSLAAAMNRPHLPVRRRPVVAIIASGDELVMPGSQVEQDQIVASNSFGVAALVQTAGGLARDCGIARDTLDSLREALQRAEDADIVVTLGGASVGDHDLVQEALEDHGVSIGFWKLAMRPGKPVMFGKRTAGSQPVRFIGLPGNPVSSLVGTQVFVVPLIRAMLGLDPSLPFEDAVLDKDLPANDEREEYMRASCRTDARRTYVSPFDVQDSSLLRQYAQADCLMLRDANALPAKVGDACRILRLRR